MKPSNQPLVKEYRISLKRLKKKIVLNLFFMVVIMAVLSLIVHEGIMDTNLTFYERFGLPILLTAGLIFLHGLLIYNYFKTNRTTLVFIDKENNLITIEQEGEKFTFRADEVNDNLLVEGYRIGAGFEYLRIEVEGHPEYIYITSLLMDYSEFLIWPTKVVKDYLPLVDWEKTLEKQIVKDEMENRQLIEAFKKRFAKKSNEELADIIYGNQPYTNEATNGARELLKERIGENNLYL